MIGDLPGLGVDHDGLGRARHAEGLANQLVAVHQDRQIVARLRRLGQDRLAAVSQAGVQHRKLDALGAIGRRQRLQGWGEMADGRIAVGLGDQHHRRRIAKAVQFVGFQVGVHQHEVVDRRRRARGRIHGRTLGRCGR